MFEYVDGIVEGFNANFNLSICFEPNPEDCLYSFVLMENVFFPKRECDYNLGFVDPSKLKLKQHVIIPLGFVLSFHKLVSINIYVLQITGNLEREIMTSLLMKLYIVYPYVCMRLQFATFADCFRTLQYFFVIQVYS